MNSSKRLISSVLYANPRRDHAPTLKDGHDARRQQRTIKDTGCGKIVNRAREIYQIGL